MKIHVKNHFCIVSLLGIAFAVSLGTHGGALADIADETTVDERQYAVAFQVDGVKFQYVEAFGEFPTPDEVRQMQVRLSRVGDKFVAPTNDLETETIQLNQIGRDEVVYLDRSAIDTIANGLQSHFSQEYNAAFLVAVDDRDIDPHTGRDLRRRGRGPLHFKIQYIGPTYAVDGFGLNYLFEDLPGQPSLDQLQSVSVLLYPTEQYGYVAWWPSGEPVELTLGEIHERPAETYSASAVQAVLSAVRDELADGYRLLAVNVSPSEPERLTQSSDEPMTVELSIVTGVVTQTRTLAIGQRFPAGPERVNHPRHARILERSPVQPDDPEKQLLRRDRIDDYVYRLSRHPGRRIDVAIAPGEPIEGADGLLAPTASLDYIVTENRPWTLYAQGSNTGTRNTGRWRQRFGLLHTQLTNNDDILNVDYQTAEFSDVHTVTGYYDVPVFGAERLRARVYGHWSEFDASEVGFANLRFTGESWSVGGELAANVYQRNQLFVDLLLGARYLNTKVENFFFDFAITEGEQDFFLPYIGARLERFTMKSSTTASLIFEGQIGDVTNVEQDELDSLGRLFPARDWLTMRWDAEHSFFLEPLLNRQGWQDPETPESSTLAHEISLSFRGQYAFEDRLTPQQMMVAGGMYTVRGYPEAIVSGDAALIGTAEYRFYLPRILGINPDPQTFLGREIRGGRQPFRWTPQHVYGRADWDLIFRGFLDVGHTINHDRLAFENDETLVGAGVGVEFLFRRNLNLRVDWGIALTGVEDRYSSGSSRVHFVGTILF